jgi:hypothetical protein
MAERPVERIAVVLCEEVSCEGLAAVLVHALEDLVCGSVAEAREEREETFGD